MVPELFSNWEDLEVSVDIQLVVNSPTPQLPSSLGTDQLFLNLSYSQRGSHIARDIPRPGFGNHFNIPQLPQRTTASERLKLIIDSPQVVLILPGSQLKNEGKQLPRLKESTWKSLSSSWKWTPDVIGADVLLMVSKQWMRSLALLIIFIMRP